MRDQIRNQKSKIENKISRRAFLRLALLAAIGAVGAYIFKSTEPVGLGKMLRWLWRGQTARWFAPKSRVALAACESYDANILAALRRAWRDARAPDLNNARIVLKPNLVDFIAGYPTFTHPRVTQAMIHLARELGARDIIVADGPAFRRDARAILDATGYTEMLAREKIAFVDLNYDDLVAVPLVGGYTRLKSLFIARTIADADVFVSMPKLKTHHWTQMSASVKNLFGIVPGIKYGWPKNTLHTTGIPVFLTELVESLPTRACAAVDGIVGLEGDGPIFGSAVPSGVLAVGTDLLAVDATCARLIGLDPARMDYLDFASWVGVGAIVESKIELVGDALAQFARAYERPPRPE
jgi:uncharacterized protein (DUF362 family)